MIDASIETGSFRVEIVGEKQLKDEKSQYVRRWEESESCMRTLRLVNETHV